MMLVLALLGTTTLKSQNHSWTKTLGTATPVLTTSKSVSIAKDQVGNIFTTGSFVGTVDFDPGAGISNLTSGGIKDAFITKFDPAGNFIWAKKLGGADNLVDAASTLSITTDLSGNVIVVGNFTGDMDINPDPGSIINLSSIGSSPGTPGPSDAYVLKLNSTGDYLWSQRIGSTSTTSGEFANTVATDNIGNVYVGGSFAGITDFDASAATVNATPVALSDIYILKLSATGSFGFVKTMGGTGTEVANAITIDGAGNIYTTGSFTLTADFDPSASAANLTSNGSGDIFVSKLNNLGNYVWAKSFGSNVTNFADQGNAIFVDEAGNVYTTGSFRGVNAANPIDFNPGTGTDNILNVGASDMFISKLDAAGNYLWAKTTGSTTNDIGYAISSDPEGNIYILGSFSGNADFDPDPTIDNFITPTAASGGGNSTDLFLTKFDETGVFVSVNTIGSNGTDIGYGLIIDGASNIFIAGLFSGTADFDPAATIVNFSPASTSDAFVTKWNFCTNIGALPTTPKTKVKPVGALNLATIYANTNCEIIAKVTPTGASPVTGNITAKVWLETIQPNTANAKFVKRHYEITPATSATTATAIVTLYFTQKDFDDFNAISSIKLPVSATDALGIVNLLVEKRSGISNNGTGLPSSYTSTVTNINPIDGDIMWNEGAKRWEVSFATTGFSGFFIKTQTALLPIRWLDVNGNINKQNQATINWKVQEIDVLEYALEKSKDGYSFNEINTTTAVGNGEHNYSIADDVKEINAIYYRIKQVGKNGLFTYSPIIKLQPYNSKQISIYPNPVKDIVTISVGASTLNKKIQITDLNGKTLQSIKVTSTSFTVDLAAYPSGVYFLKLEDGKTEKIIKQ